ncbi:MAG: YggS family pyridoxal phosphate-dependent enzyme [Clostridia bacterium]|nr:YggS family pyridoxal phosphate-dependent enzyme [Clostridia bacterium]
MNPAVPLLTTQQVSAECLAGNVRHILDNLAKNRFENSPPARLIAVTKTVAPDVINLLKPLQILDIGENRAQVAMPKMPQIEPDFRLHWIGRLQTNKVKYIIDSVYMLHTLDRLALAQEVQRRAAECGRVIPALVQVNISGEEQKGGMPPEEVLPFLRQMKDFSNIHIQGLMSIMPAMATEQELTSLFRGMRCLFERLRQEAVQGVDMRELSMGMSGDYAVAAREGATMVRIGTALYQPSGR